MPWPRPGMSPHSPAALPPPSTVHDPEYMQPQRTWWDFAGRSLDLGELGLSGTSCIHHRSGSEHVHRPKCAHLRPWTPRCNSRHIQPTADCISAVFPMLSSAAVPRTPGAGNSGSCTWPHGTGPVPHPHSPRTSHAHLCRGTSCLCGDKDSIRPGMRDDAKPCRGFWVAAHS